MEKEILVTQYVAVWNWHIISIIFLVGAFIVVFSGKSMGNNVMFIVFLLMFGLCETIAFYRKRKLELFNTEQETEGNEISQEEDDE